MNTHIIEAFGGTLELIGWDGKEAMLVARGWSWGPVNTEEVVARSRRVTKYIVSCDAETRQDLVVFSYKIGGPICKPKNFLRSVRKKLSYAALEVGSEIEQKLADQEMAVDMSVHHGRCA